MPEDPHCSKCCPVEQPEPPEPWSPPSVVYLWLAIVAVVMVGGWGLIVWGLAGGWR
ncbi:hypothetical protein [Streptomyces sp. S465]|uniref:hypothetical protein n=1 Tax=Streptomyces sp. S465 TaxID=2979468 RepID=UPI0022A8CB38|nr:hypothetical protein [Streptomyces sp. S465]WAP60329.1 hypothetical protein N6H00_38150 [Streptomyces sp. S465]